MWGEGEYVGEIAGDGGGGKAAKEVAGRMC